MIGFAPWHHAEFHHLQPALLFPTLGPGPVAAVTVSLAQPPEVEIETLGSHCPMRLSFS